MQVTLDIPDPVAKEFFAKTPARRRSSTVARLLRAELRRKRGDLPKHRNGLKKLKNIAELEPGWFSKRYKKYVGCIKNGPTDLAENHDHYAHGSARRSAV